MSVNNNSGDNFGTGDVKHILNILVNKVDNYERKLDNIEVKVNDLSFIRHQMESFTKQVTEIQTDLKSLRIDYQDFKSIEYRIEDLIKWKNQIEQTLTVSDMVLLKSKNFNQELLINQLSERLTTVREEVKKEINSRTLFVGGITSGVFTLFAEIALYLFKYHPK